MFKALIWGIVRFCRSNIYGDMIKKLKNCFFKKCQFLHFLLTLKVKNCFLKKQLFSILIISLVIFDLQKHTIPQIKAWNILFWPYFIHFTARMGIWWAMKPRKCAVFCSTDFTCKVLGYYNKNICSVKILLCKAWPTLLNYT